jgi:hypothetical protein
MVQSASPLFRERDVVEVRQLYMTCALEFILRDGDMGP